MKSSTSGSVKIVCKSLGRPTRSIRLLQTDREAEDRLRDKRRSSADFLKVPYLFCLVGYLNKCYFKDTSRLRRSLGRCATSSIEAHLVHF